VALFPWKKSSGADKGTTGEIVNGASGDTKADGNAEFQAQPDKARKWFDYARNAADTSNFDYALTCYANGIKFDPEAMSAHEAMYEAAIKHSLG
jgi:hypothetical protein